MDAAPTYVDAGVTIEPIPQVVEDAVVQSALDFYADMEAADPFFAKVMQSLRDWRDAYNQVLPRL